MVEAAKSKKGNGKDSDEDYGTPQVSYDRT